MTTFHLYSRRGCHLCEAMIEALLPLLRGQAEIAVHDIDTDPQWRKKYHRRVPVLEYSGRMLCEGHLDVQAIAAVLDEIADP